MQDQWCEKCGELMCFEERDPEERQDDEECGIPPQQMVCPKCWLAEFVRDYHGHQAYAIRDLAAKDDQLRDELIQLGVTWALPDDENEE